MRRSVTQARERKAVRRVAGIVEDDLDWLFREQPLPDYGVDAQGEVVTGDELVTGRFLGLQIRGGDSRFARPRGKKGWTQALDEDDQGRPLGEKVAVWMRLLDDPADDAMTARCVAWLARLGTWPPQAEELRSRSVLPAEEYDVLKAVCRARSGEPGVGIARLRELADKSLLAAGELVQLLEEDAGPEAAITEAEQQITRWQAPSLRIQYVDLPGRHGRFGDAAAFIERTIPDDSLPADVRQKLCAWYLGQLAGQGRFTDAAATARAGLAIGEDPGLAWKLIMVLVNDGKLHDARQALARYRPEPGTDQEIRLWMQLHLGVEVTAADARVMISLVRRQPDGEFRDAIIAMLIREIVLAEKTSSFPGDVTAAVARLEEETWDRPGTGLRIDPDDDEALRAALGKRQPDQAGYRKLLTAVQDGAASMADIARFAERPYGTVLLHRPVGVLPAADLAPGLRAAGEQAARRAIAAGTCVADLSSLHLLGLLSDDDRLKIRSALPSLIVARAAVDDALLTRDHTRGTEAATYTASLAADGTIERTVLTAVQQALLRGQAETLERATVSADVRYPRAPGRPARQARRKSTARPASPPALRADGSHQRTSAASRSRRRVRRPAPAPGNRSALDLAGRAPVGADPVISQRDRDQRRLSAGARSASGATSGGRPSPNSSRRVLCRARISTTYSSRDPTGNGDFSLP